MQINHDLQMNMDANETSFELKSQPRAQLIKVLARLGDSSHSESISLNLGS